MIANSDKLLFPGKSGDMCELQLLVREMLKKLNYETKIVKKNTKRTENYPE